MSPFLYGCCYFAMMKMRGMLSGCTCLQEFTFSFRWSDKTYSHTKLQRLQRENRELLWKHTYDWQSWDQKVFGCVFFFFSFKLASANKKAPVVSILTYLSPSCLVTWLSVCSCCSRSHLTDTVLHSHCSTLRCAAWKLKHRPLKVQSCVKLVLASITWGPS